MAKLFLFRHAQTTDNVHNIFSGKRDPELTPEGEEEARGIRHKLKNEKVTKAYCAPNIRTRHTLEIALEGHTGFEIVADPRIRERDYGDLTGKNKKETERLYPKDFPIWHRSYDTSPPNGESLKDAEERTLAFIKEMEANVWQNDIIFICTSGNIIRAFRRHYEKLTTKEMTGFEHTPGTVYTYDL